MAYVLNYSTIGQYKGKVLFFFVWNFKVVFLEILEIVKPWLTPGRGSLRNYSKIDVRDSCWAQRDKGLSTSRAERLHHSNVPLYVLLH